MTNKNALIPQVLTGDIKRGGWKCTFRVQGETDAIADGQAVQILAKSGASFFDTEFRQVFSGNAIAAQDNIIFDRYTSTSTVIAGTANELLIGGNIQTIGFTSQATPLNDHQITDNSLALEVEHILKRHCNFIFQADMPDGIISVLSIDVANSVKLDRYNVDKSENFWRSLQNIGGGESSGEFYRCWFNKKNEFFYQRTPMFGGLTSLGTIDKSFIWGKPRVKLHNNQPGAKVGQVHITAIKDSQTIFTASFPFLAIPGIGKILPPKDGIFAEKQSEAFFFAQRMFEWLTRPFTVTLNIDPAFVAFEVDLGDKITLDYNGPVDTPDGILHLDLTGDYIIYGARIQFDARGFFAIGSLTLEFDNST